MIEIVKTGNEQLDTRRERFEGVRAGYEADGPRFDSINHTHVVERYAVVTESLDSDGYLVNYAETLQDVERVAALNIYEGWQPVCYYDLDELDGLEPDAEIGDVVQVIGSDSSFVVGEIEYDSEPIYRARDFPADERWMAASAAEIIERGPSYEEERNPKRYLVAKVQTFVAFNTDPAPR